MLTAFKTFNPTQFPAYSPLLTTIFCLIFSVNILQAQQNFDLQVPALTLRGPIILQENADSSLRIWSKEYNLTVGSSLKISTLNASGINVSNRFLASVDQDSKLVEMPNHGVMILGYSLAKLDSTGAMAWKKTYRDPELEINFQSVVATTDSGYILCGYLQSSFTNLYPFFLMKADQDGNVVWSKKMDLDLQGEDIRVIKDMGNGKILLGGMLKHPFTFVENPLLIMADTAGHILWTKSLDGLGKDVLTDIVPLGDNKVAVIGHTQNYGAGGHDIFILTFNTDGQLLRAASYGAQADETPVSAVVKPNGNILLTGYNGGYTSLSTHAFWAEIDTAGQLLYAWKSNDSLSTGSRILPVSDHGVLVAQLAEINHDWSQYLLRLIKTRENGKPECPGFTALPWLRNSFTPNQETGYSISVNDTLFTSEDLPLSNITTLQISPIIPCSDTCKIVAQFQPDRFEICQGTLLHCTNTSLGTPQAFSWYVNGQQADSTVHFAQAFSEAGTYTIQLVAHDTLCQDSATVFITVLPELQPGFTSNNALMVATFNDISTGATGRRWEFGDGTFSSLRSPEHVYPAPGTYQMCLTVFNNCDTQKICKTLELADRTLTSFFHEYPTPGTGQQWPSAIAKTRDGGLMITGEDRYYGSTGGKLMMTKLDHQGTREWAGVIQEGLDLEGLCVQECPDLGFLFGGHYEISNDRWATILKTNRKGGLQWRGNFRVFNSNDGVTSCSATSDSGYVFSGGSASRIFVGKINAGGRLEWLRFFNGGRSGKCIIETPDKGFLSVGESSIGGDVYLLKLDAKGNRLWSKEYDSNGYDFGNSIAPMKNGHYILTGGGSGNTSGQDLFTLEIDADGTPITSKFYDIGYQEFGNSVSETANGNLLISGTFSYRPFTLSTDPSGAVVWGNTYLNIFGANGVATYDEGIAIPGYMVNIGFEKVIVVKTDKNGQVNCQQNPANFVVRDAVFTVAPSIFDTLLPFEITSNDIYGYASYFFIDDNTFCQSDLCGTLASNVSKKDLGCTGSDEARAWVAPTGGNPPYRVSWSNGQTGDQIEHLKAGKYFVTVEDAATCRRVDSIEIVQLKVDAYFSVVKPDCAGAPNGSIAVTFTEGQPPFNIQWNNGASGTTLNGLAPGVYSIAVTDQQNCIFTDSVVLTPTTLEINTAGKEFVCFGYADGTAQVNITGEIPPFVQITWSNGATSAQITDLTAGTYTVTVTDGNSCIAVDSVVILESFVNIAAQVTDAPCFATQGGSIQVAVLNMAYPPASFLWPDGSSNAIIYNLYPGTHYLIIFDAVGCAVAKPIVVGEPPQLTSTVTTTPDLVATPIPDGTATVAVTGGTPPYTYLWSDPIGQTTATAINLPPGVYYVTITDNANCITYGTANIDLSVAASEANTGKVRVYPNPLSDHFNLTMEGVSQSDYKIDIFNANGQTVPNFKVRETSPGSLEITAESLNPGVYFIRLRETATGQVNVYQVVFL